MNGQIHVLLVRAACCAVVQCQVKAIVKNIVFDKNSTIIKQMKPNKQQSVRLSATLELECESNNPQFRYTKSSKKLGINAMASINIEDNYFLKL